MVHFNTNKLELIRLATGYSVKDWAELLHRTEAEYRRLARQDDADIPESVILELSESLEISPEAIISGMIDYAALSKRFSGGSAVLPEIYAQNAFSRRRTSVHLLDYLEIHYGWRLRSNILKHFQITEQVFGNPDEKISVRFVTDLCDHLEASGFNEDSFFRMGQYSVVANYHSKLGDAFREQRDPSRVYEACFTEIANRFYDENFRYTLVRLDEHRCVAEVRPNPTVLESLHMTKIGSVATCWARRGTISTMVGYLGLPFAQVKEETCVHRGDLSCRYEINFEQASWFARRKQAFHPHSFSDLEMNR